MPGTRHFNFSRKISETVIRIVGGSAFSEMQTALSAAVT